MPVTTVSGQSKSASSLAPLRAATAALLLGAVAGLSPAHAGPDAESWYHIEVILFNQATDVADETFATDTLPVHERTSVAVDDADPAAPDADIEVSLLTQQRAAALAETEAFLAELRLEQLALPPATDTAAEAGTMPSTASASGANATAPDEIPVDYDLAFSAAPYEQRLLTPLVEKLNGRAGTTVAAHYAWRQPALTSDAALPVLLDAAAHPRRPVETAVLAPEKTSFNSTGLFPAPKHDALTGTARIFAATYLHVDLNLWRHLPALRLDEAANAVPVRLNSSPAATAMTQVRLGWPEADDTGGQAEPTEIAQLAQLRTQRRVRLSELHYFDHPHLGALVQIERFDPIVGEVISN